MKKKITAVLLTLCLVLGMLPLSAMAVWKTSDGKSITKGGTQTVGGKTYQAFTIDGESDGKIYYTLKSLYDAEKDTPEYYTFAQIEAGLTSKSGTLKWENTGDDVEVSVEPETSEATGDDTPTLPAGKTAKKTSATPTQQAVQAAIAEKEGAATTFTLNAKSTQLSDDDVVVDAEVELSTDVVDALKDMTSTTIETDVGTVKLPKEALAKAIGKGTTLVVKKVSSDSVAIIKNAADATAKFAPVEVDLTGIEVENLSEPIVITVPADESVVESANALDPVYIVHVHNGRAVSASKAVFDDEGEVVISTTSLSTFIQTTKEGVMEIYPEAGLAAYEILTADIDSGATRKVTVKELPVGIYVYFQLATPVGTFGGLIQADQDGDATFTVSRGGTLNFWVMEGELKFNNESGAPDITYLARNNDQTVS